jgi:nucleoside-triphosphatase THEP1
LVDTARSFLATVPRHHHPLTDRLKARSDGRIIEVTQRNRNRLPVELVASLTKSG